MEYQALFLGFDAVATAAIAAVLGFFKKHPSDERPPHCHTEKLSTFDLR